MHNAARQQGSCLCRLKTGDQEALTGLFVPAAKGCSPGELHQDGAAFLCESCGQAVEVHPTAALQSIRSQTDDLPGVKVACKGPAQGYDQI